MQWVDDGNGRRLPDQFNFPRTYNLNDGKSVETQIEIGRLTCGSVRRGELTYRNGRKIPVAVKMTTHNCDLNDENQADPLLHELNVLQSLPEHESIVKFHDGIIVEGVVVMVEELMIASLKWLMREEERRESEGDQYMTLYYSHLLSIFCDIVFGLQHLHRHIGPHNNLKPSKVLLGRNYKAKTVYLGSWSLQREGTSTNFQTGGTEAAAAAVSIAPERIESSQSNVNPYKIDVCSLGVIMGECVTGQTPDPMCRDTSGNARFAFSDGYPKELKKLIERCVKKENSDQPDCEEVQSLLKGMSNQEWVNDVWRVVPAFQDEASAPQTGD